MKSVLECAPAEALLQEINDLLESPAIDSRDRLPAPPFDRVRLLERCLDNLEFALVLLDEFETTSESRLSGFRTALAEQDRGAIAFKAHALKGVVGILAADALKATCSRLEAAANAADWDKTRDLIQQLEQEMQEAIDFIPHIRATP